MDSFIDVTCAIIVVEGKMLFTQRSEDMDHPLWWEFPGGKRKLHETLEICIHREIWEEMEVEIRIIRKLPVVDHEYPHKNIRLHPFLCSIRKGKIKLAEHKQFAWISPADLDNQSILPADRKIIDNLLKGNEISILKSD